MKKIKMLLICALTLAMMNSCATGFSSSEQSVIIMSKPAGQNFTITNNLGETIHSGSTPETVMLDTSIGFYKPAVHTVKFNNGKSISLEGKMSIFYVGNVFTLLGFVVDPFTGAMWDLPDKVNVSSGSVQKLYPATTMK
jgi:hypothetical protein